MRLLASAAQAGGMPMSHLPQVAAALAASPLTLAALQGELLQLQALLGAQAEPALQASANRIQGLCQQLEDCLYEGLRTLADAGEGLSGLITLLGHAEGQPLPAQQLAVLLAPLQQQVLRADSQLRQLF